MKKRDGLTKFLAIAGTALVWFPLLVPFFFSLMRGRGFRIDYLIPAELFPVALAGGVLLFWAALRARQRRGLIGWGLLTAVVTLVGGQLLAVVTGLASGEAEPTGVMWSLVMASIAVYSLALVMVGLGGVLLVRDLFKPAQPTAG